MSWQIIAGCGRVRMVTLAAFVCSSSQLLSLERHRNQNRVVATGHLLIYSRMLGNGEIGSENSSDGAFQTPRGATVVLKHWLKTEDSNG